MCADRPHVSQVLKHSNYLQTVYSLVQSSSVKIKIFSKALIARLIPVDTIKDDVAVLLLIDDEELHYLIKILTLSQSKYAAVPIVPVMVDLSRSPHNLYAFVTKGIASLLSDIMDSISEHDQIMAAQLIWRIMTFNYKENESTSAIICDGTLQKSLDDEGNLSRSKSCATLFKYPLIHYHVMGNGEINIAITDKLITTSAL